MDNKEYNNCFSNTTISKHQDLIEEIKSNFSKAQQLYQENCDKINNLVSRLTYHSQRVKNRKYNLRRGVKSINDMTVKQFIITNFSKQKQAFSAANVVEAMHQNNYIITGKTGYYHSATMALNLLRKEGLLVKKDIGYLFKK